MFNPFAILETFSCGCGRILIPTTPFVKRYSIKNGSGPFGYSLVECPSCGTLWHQEDGYWNLLTKEGFKEIKDLRNRAIDYRENFSAPITIKRVMEEMEIK